MVRPLSLWLALALPFVLATRGIASADDTPPQTAAPNAPRPNRPPKLTTVDVEPGMFELEQSGEQYLRAGRRARVVVAAEDPDGDRLTFSLGPLPAGATFEAGRGVLSWLPTRAQQGKHRLQLRVSDGELSAERQFVLVVQPNRAPVATDDDATLRVLRPVRPVDPGPLLRAGDGATSTTIASDPDADEVTFRVRDKPAGVRLEASNGAVSFVWQPTPADVGEHTIVLDVSDGELTSTIRRRVVVIPEWLDDDYRGWFLLGGGPAGFVTHGNGEVLLGGALDLTLVAIRGDGSHAFRCAEKRHDDGCHASHHRFYGEFEVLDSRSSGEPSLFTYGVGYSASFEWNPVRRYFIPHYGIEVGGLVRSGPGHLAQTRPYLGLHLWASEQIWVNLSLGYRVVPAELYDLSGPTFALHAVLNPW